jgi:hypothetical protein
MKKLFALAAITACALPSLALAAYNDVTLTTDAVIQVGSYTLDVWGSSATIQSITVNSSNFSVTLASGSAVTVTSPTLQQLSSDVSSDVVSNPCTGSESSISLAYSGAGTVTNVITPSATVCSGSGSTPPPAPPPSGGGGMIVGSGPLAPSASSFFNYSSPGFQTVTPGATVVPPVATSIASTTAAAPYVFSKNHHQGDTGADILALQQFLNTHGFQVASSGPGSPGHESTFFGAKTYQALIKFQKANNLPATGYFGPLTRALINSQVR